MFRTSEKGNITAMALVVVAIVAIGALAYLSFNMNDGDKDASVTSANPDDVVVAKVSEHNVYRSDVIDYINTLPAQARQIPVGQLYPAALDHVINATIVKVAAANAGLSDNPEVVEALNAAKEEILANVYLKNKIEEQVSEEDVRQAYADYVESFPAAEEALVAHILVDSETKAKALIKDLKAGANFADLAAKNSLDPGSKDNGGKVGYFTKADVVPEFGQAAFAQEIGIISAEPVKTEYGYHVIKVENRRLREPLPYEEVKESLRVQLNQQAAQKILRELREDASIEVFDINGNPVSAAGSSKEQPEDASAFAPDQAGDSSPNGSAE